MTINTVEPVEITAGNTLTFQKTLADYAAGAGWNITYTLLNAANKITFTSSASGDDHLISVAAATTAAYAVGDYDYTATVSDGTDRHTVATGRIKVLADPTATALLDGRSNARKIVESLEAALIAYHTNSQGHVASYSIAGRSMTFRSSAEIIEQIEYWRGQVVREEKAERIKNGLKSGNRILVRFN